MAHSSVEHQDNKKQNLFDLDEPQGNLMMSLNLISSARLQIDLFSNNLDPQTLDHEEIIDAIIAFIKISPRSRLRILIVDASTIISKGHRIIELYRKFSSYIEIRGVCEEFQSSAFSFLLTDQHSLLYRPISSRWEALLTLNQKRMCRDRQAFFNHVWQHSQPLSKLRQLHM